MWNSSPIVWELHFVQKRCRRGTLNRLDIYECDEHGDTTVNVTKCTTAKVIFKTGRTVRAIHCELPYIAFYTTHHTKTVTDNCRANLKASSKSTLSVLSTVEAEVPQAAMQLVADNGEGAHLHTVDPPLGPTFSLGTIFVVLRMTHPFLVLSLQGRWRIFIARSSENAACAKLWIWLKWAST